MLRKLGFSVPIAAGIVVVLNASASAGFNAYVSGTTGYDYSYIQCGSAAPAASFGIVGVNAGYPFTYYNSCLASEYAAAAGTGNAAVYVNTGYDPTYTAIDGRHTTQECTNASLTVAGTQPQQAAWAVGCRCGVRDSAIGDLAHRVVAGCRDRQQLVDERPDPQHLHDPGNRCDPAPGHVGADRGLLHRIPVDRDHGGLPGPSGCELGRDRPAHAQAREAVLRLDRIHRSEGLVGAIPRDVRPRPGVLGVASSP